MIEDTGNSEGESLPAYPKISSVSTYFLMSSVIKYLTWGSWPRFAGISIWQTNQRWEQKGPSLEVILVSVLQGGIVRYVSDQAAVASKVRMMVDSCWEGNRDICLGCRDGTVPEKQKTRQEPEAGSGSSWVAILKENSNFIYFCEDTLKENHAFIHQGRAFGWKIRNPRQSLLGEATALWVDGY